MAIVIELKRGVPPPGRIRHALVIASEDYPPTGTAYVEVGSSRAYFADDREEALALVIEQATAWADVRGVPNVYLKRV